MKKANQRGERIADWFMKAFPIAFPICISVECFGSAVYSYYIYGYVNVDALYYPFNYAFPWNQHTLPGWTFLVFFSASTCTSYLFVIPAFLTFFISICDFHGAFYKMFQGQVNGIDRIAATKQHQSGDVKKLICESIVFHISAKR